jgi:thioester reductase-like protein
MQTTVFDSQAFNALRAIHPDFNKWIQERIVPIQGDITKERFGMSPHDYA